jgi:hypothetical protein
MFWYRSRICLVENRLFWSRICSPGPNRNDLFRWGRFGNELRCYGFIPVGCRNVCGTFVELLFLFVLTLGNPFFKFDFAPLSPEFRCLFNSVGIGCTDPFGERDQMNCEEGGRDCYKRNSFTSGPNALVITFWKGNFLKVGCRRDRMLHLCNNVSLDDPSVILYPLDFVSLGRCVPWMMRPLDDASPR